MLWQCSRTGQKLERETGIEPATNSLEGCDSTTELLPPSSTARGCAPNPRPVLAGTPLPRAGLAEPRRARLGTTAPMLVVPRAACVVPRAAGRHENTKNGGEGRIRTSEATWATDLQSVAFDRSATSPTSALRQCLAILSAGRCITNWGCAPNPRRPLAGTPSPRAASAEAHCVRLGGRLLECSSSPFLSCVVPRSHIFEYAPSSRLVSRVSDRSRCDAGFHHGLLELAKGFEPPTR